MAGLALLSVVRMGFLGAATGGGGLVVARDRNTGAWSAPCAVGLAGLSIGAQVGIELNTVVLVLRNQAAVDVVSSAAQVNA